MLIRKGNPLIGECGLIDRARILEKRDYSARQWQSIRWPRICPKTPRAGHLMFVDDRNRRREM